MSGRPRKRYPYINLRSIFESKGEFSVRELAVKYSVPKIIVQQITGESGVLKLRYWAMCSQSMGSNEPCEECDFFDDEGLCYHHKISKESQSWIKRRRESRQARDERNKHFK